MARAGSPTSSSLLQSADGARRVVMEKVSRLPQALLDVVDGFVFDCDGVIWRAGELCDSRIPDVLRKLQTEHKKKIFFVTNNSTKSKEVFFQKLRSLGIECAEREHFYTAAYACAEYIKLFEPRLLKKRDPATGLGGTHAAYMLGMHGLEEELRAGGVEVVGGPSDKAFEKRMDDFMERSVKGAMEKGIFAMENIQPPSCEVLVEEKQENAGTTICTKKPIGAVVCGFDPRLNYFKIQSAQLCLSEKYGAGEDCKFIATNPDAVAHITPDQEWAGNGCCVGAIKGCTGREPIYTGKPSSLLLDILCKRHCMQRDRLVMVGDRLDTDILFGRSNKMQTVLVLSGVTTEANAEKADPTMTPNFCISTVGEFL
mmetsp:Transcript_4695/g.11522  ORF Transcript_4695/g.11522 Transcript_4695/m.11522 type:complete len:370 (+) Transcript_4695:490-1599(+)